MLKTYDPLKVNVAFNSRQLRMFGDRSEERRVGKECM